MGLLIVMLLAVLLLSEGSSISLSHSTLLSDSTSKSDDTAQFLWMMQEFSELSSSPDSTLISYTTDSSDVEELDNQNFLQDGIETDKSLQAS